MRKFLLLLSFSGILLCYTPSFAEDGGFTGLLRTGSFHGEEVSAKSGERWFGLYQAAGGWALRDVKIKVKTVRDEIVDGPEGENTGKKVTAEGEPLLLVKGPAFREGPVTASFHGEKELHPGTAVEFSLGKDRYLLTALGSADGEGAIKDYRLSLALGNTSQEFGGLEWCCDDNIPRVVWAGDIDGDGRLDLLVDLSNHYNISAWTLFLSTAAGEGELVGKAAEFITYGC